MSLTNSKHIFLLTFILRTNWATNNILIYLQCIQQPKSNLLSKHNLFVEFSKKNLNIFPKKPFGEEYMIK
jgi:hypothetical protein